MLSNVYKKILQLYTSPTDVIEVALSIGKILWSYRLMTYSPILIDAEFYHQIQQYHMTPILGSILFIDALIKLYAWLNGNTLFRKNMSLIGVLFWTFLLTLTILAHDYSLALIEITVLILCDVWLYIRLGAVKDDFTNNT